MDPQEADLRRSVPWLTDAAVIHGYVYPDDFVLDLADQAIAQGMTARMGLDDVTNIFVLADTRWLGYLTDRSYLRASCHWCIEREDARVAYFFLDLPDVRRRKVTP